MTNLPKNLRDEREKQLLDIVKGIKLDGAEKIRYVDGFRDGSEFCYSHLCQAPEGFKKFTALDASETVECIDIAAIAQLKTKHESELELLRKQLEKAVEQRNKRIQLTPRSMMLKDVKNEIADYDAELAAIGKG